MSVPKSNVTRSSGFQEGKFEKINRRQNLSPSLEFMVTTKKPTARKLPQLDSTVKINSELRKNPATDM